MGAKRRGVLRWLFRLIASRRRLRRRMQWRNRALRTRLAKAKVRAECMQVEIDMLWDVVNRNQQRVANELSPE